METGRAATEWVPVLDWPSRGPVAAAAGLAALVLVSGELGLRRLVPAGAAAVFLALAVATMGLDLARGRLGASEWTAAPASIAGYVAAGVALAGVMARVRLPRGPAADPRQLVAIAVTLATGTLTALGWWEVFSDEIDRALRLFVTTSWISVTAAAICLGIAAEWVAPHGTRRVTVLLAGPLLLLGLEALEASAVLVGRDASSLRWGDAWLNAGALAGLLLTLLLLALGWLDRRRPGRLRVPGVLRLDRL